MKKRNLLLLTVLLLQGVLAYFGSMECIYLKYFHVICPGCGMTRAINAIMHFQFKKAFYCHPMVYSLPVILLYIVTDGKPIKNRCINNVVLIFIGIGFLINYIIKLIV